MIESSSSKRSGTPSREVLADRACTAFCGLVHSLHSLDRGEWADLDLTMSQLKTIMMIVETGGLSGRELAERLGIGPSGVTALVDRLVQRGYVRREEDSLDRRVSWTRPTEQATTLYERLHAIHRERLKDILSALSPADLALAERALSILEAAASEQVQERRAPGVARA